MASDRPLDTVATEAAIRRWNEAGETAIVSGSAAVSAFTGQAVILTDDYAPVDQLLGR